MIGLSSRKRESPQIYLLRISVQWRIKFTRVRKHAPENERIKRESKWHEHIGWNYLNCIKNNCEITGNNKWSILAGNFTSFVIFRSRATFKNVIIGFNGFLFILFYVILIDILVFIVSISAAMATLSAPALDDFIPPNLKAHIRQLPPLCFHLSTYSLRLQHDLGCQWPAGDSQPG